MKFFRAFAAVPAGLLLLGICLSACSKDERTAGSVVSYQAKDLRTGEAVDLADLRGKAVLLSGWATTCAPCRKELPELDRLYQERKDEGLEVVAVNIDPAGASSKQIIPTVDELKLTMPTWKDTDAGFVRAFQAASIPTNVLVGRDGKVIKVWSGPIDFNDGGFRNRLDAAIG